MRKTYLKSLILFIMTLFLCSYGYVGNLPELGASSRQAVEQPETDAANKQIENPVKPSLAPKDFPDMYSGVIINQGKYSQYLKDVDEIIPIIENIKQLIQEETTLQLFCAKSTVLNLYVNNLKQKYANKPEKHYETYKQLVKLNDGLTDLSNYWRNTLKYKKIIRGSSNNRASDDKIISKRLETALNSINMTLEVLKENKRSD